MAKRLHDTDCWRKSWFRSLNPSSKLLWLYLLDTCDAAGVVEVDDLEQIGFFIGSKISQKNIQDLSKQIKAIDLKRILILDFIDFQYGKLHAGHKMYGKVLELLAKFNIKYPIDTVSGYPIDRGKDKDKDKDKEEDPLIPRAPGEAPIPETKGFSPPGIEEFKKYCVDNGYGNIAAQAYEGYRVADWHDSQGKKLKNWKQKMQHVWFRPENRQKMSPLSAGNYYENQNRKEI